MSLDLPRKIALGVAALAGLLFASAALGGRAARQFAASADRVAQGEEVLEALAALSGALADAEAVQLAYLLSGDAALRNDRAGAGVAVNRCFEQVRQLTEDDPEQQQRLARLRARLSAQRGTLARLVGLGKNTVVDASRHLEATQNWLSARDDTRNLADEMEQHERALLAQERDSSRGTCRLAALGALVLALAGMAVTAWLVRLVRRVRFERAEAAVALHAQRQTIDTLLDCTSDGVIITDAEGQVTLVNGPARALTGWTQQDAAGQHVNIIFRLVDDALRQPVENSALDALRWGRVATAPSARILISRDGAERRIEQTAAPLRYEGGKVRGAVLVFRECSPTCGTTRTDNAIQTRAGLAGPRDLRA
jgi:PAS domain S-box-containing protein